MEASARCTAWRRRLRLRNLASRHVRRANRFGERLHQPLETIAILARKARDSRTIAIKYADHRAAHNERHDYFRTRSRVADDVIGERLDVVHYLRLAAQSRRAADAAARRQPRAGGPAGKRPQKQIARRRQQIEAGPVDVGQLVVDEGREVGRARDEVVFTGQQLARLALEQIVVGGTVTISTDWGYKSACASRPR